MKYSKRRRRRAKCRSCDSRRGADGEPLSTAHLTSPPAATRRTIFFCMRFSEWNRNSRSCACSTFRSARQARHTRIFGLTNEFDKENRSHIFSRCLPLCLIRRYSLFQLNPRLHGYIFSLQGKKKLFPLQMSLLYISFSLHKI